MSAEEPVRVDRIPADNDVFERARRQEQDNAARLVAALAELAAKRSTR